VQLRLNQLFDPSSVAIIGASEQNFYAANLVSRLTASGYTGALHMVNPSRPVAFGRACYTSIGDLPSPPDLALVAINAKSVVPVLKECSDAGVQAAIVVATGFEGEKGHLTNLAAELNQFLAESSLLVCGPGSLGIVNVRAGFDGFAGHRGAPMAAGPIALASQSGALVHSFIDAAHIRGIGFSHLVSSGVEANVDITDYLDYYLGNDDVGVICAFIEGLRSPERFIEVAERAASLRKPLLVLKLGKSEPAARSAIAHTGVLTGSDTFYETLFKQYGVIRGSTPEELLDRAMMFASAPRRYWPKSNRVGVVSVSGGLAGALCDVANTNDLEIPPISADSETLEGLERELKENALVAQNPLDLSGQMKREDPEKWWAAVDLFARDAAFDLIVLVDILPHNVDAVGHAASIRRKARKPVVFLNAIPSRPVLDPEAQLAAQRLQVSTFAGLEQFVRAVEAASVFSTAIRRLQDRQEHDKPDQSPRPQFSTNLIPEYEARRLLAPFGIRGPSEAFANRENVGLTATRIGFPVAVKVVSPTVAHRSELGLIAGPIWTASEAADAAEALTVRASSREAEVHEPRLLVQHWVQEGLELIVGATCLLGPRPLIMASAGGTHVELETATATRIAPITRQDAAEMLAELRVYPLFAGYRGSSPLDRDAAIDGLVSVSTFAMAAANWLGEVELNPLKILPNSDGALAIDALIAFR
jgi:acetate---CoA ligase (ADP-forming)